MKHDILLIVELVQYEASHPHRDSTHSDAESHGIARKPCGAPELAVAFVGESWGRLGEVRKTDWPYPGERSAQPSRIAARLSAASIVSTSRNSLDHCLKCLDEDF